MIRALSRADGVELETVMQPYLAEVAPGIGASVSVIVDRVWQDDDRFAYGLFAPHLAGFALVRGVAVGAFELAEFYVAPDLRRSGCGSGLAHHALTRHPGQWRLGIAPFGPGEEFWPVCLAACPAVGHIRRGPPLFPHQRGSLHFIVKDHAP